jgi:hypothetical protein
MLTEYQKLALALIFSCCDKTTHNTRLLSWMVDFYPRSLQGEVTTIPYLSMVDAVNVSTLAHCKPLDCDLVTRVAFDEVIKFIRVPITVVVGESTQTFAVVDKARWDSEFLFFQFTMSAALVRLFADLSDFIEQAEKNNDGFK